MKRSNPISPLLVVSVAAALAACAHARPAVSNSPSTGAKPTETGLAANQEPSLRNDILHEISDLKTVNFAYNSDILDSAARATLTGNAAWLKEHPEVRVQAAGNCDERGTVEYNLALGQRRAAAVRKFYAMVGVRGSRVATISYGKERPVCHESNEACWSRNRRVDTLGAFPADVSRKP